MNKSRLSPQNWGSAILFAQFVIRRSQTGNAQRNVVIAILQSSFPMLSIFRKNGVIPNLRIKLLRDDLKMEELSLSVNPFSESKNCKTIEIIRFKFAKKRIIEIPKNNLPSIHSRLYSLLENGIIRNIRMGIYRLSKGTSQLLYGLVLFLPLNKTFFFLYFITSNRDSDSLLKR